MPLVGAEQLGSDLAPLEATVSKNPNDPEALARLLDEYLARGAPGLAAAAISHATRRVRELPSIADRRARSLAELGNTSTALSVQRSVLDSCAGQDCSMTLVAHAMRREALLRQMVDLGIDHGRFDPEGTLLAHRLASREVRFELR